MCGCTICAWPDRFVEQIAAKRGYTQDKTSCLKRVVRGGVAISIGVGATLGGLGGLGIYDFICKGTLCLKENSETWIKTSVPPVAAVIGGVVLPLLICGGLKFVANCVNDYNRVPTMDPLHSAEVGQGGGERSD
jgi:hypothetical protein